MLVRGSISRNETEIVRTFGQNLYADVGHRIQVCFGCGALRWHLESTIQARREINTSFSNCCHRGEIRLPHYYDSPTPEYLICLLTSMEPSWYLHCLYDLRDADYPL